MTAARRKLGPELKRLIGEKGQTMSGAAQALGLYENSLRSWIRRNTFPEDALRKIARHVGLSGKLETLEKEFLFELAGARRTPLMKLTGLERERVVGMREALEVLGSRAGDLLRRPDTQLSEARLIFKALGAEGLYISLSMDVLPFELTGAGWAAIGKELSAAIERGAMLVYSSPSPEIATSLHELGQHSILAPHNVESALGALRNRLQENLSPSRKRRLSQQLTCLAWDAPAFLTPSVQWLYVCGHDEGGPSAQLFARATLTTEGRSGGALLPPGAETSAAFLSLLVARLEKANRKDVLERLTTGK